MTDIKKIEFKYANDLHGVTVPVRYVPEFSTACVVTYEVLAEFSNGGEPVTRPTFTRHVTLADIITVIAHDHNHAAVYSAYFDTADLKERTALKLVEVEPQTSIVYRPSIKFV